MPLFVIDIMNHYFVEQVEPHMRTINWKQNFGFKFSTNICNLFVSSSRWLLIDCWKGKPYSEKVGL